MSAFLKFSIRFVIVSIIAVPVFLAGGPAYAQALPSEHISEEELKKEIVSVKKNGFLLIPFTYYTPETQIAGGMVFITYFRNQEKPEEGAEDETQKDELPLQIRPSTIATTLTYTQENQFIWELFPELYMDNERYHIIGIMQYLKYPDRFYGIGNDTSDDYEEYTADIFRSRFDMQREFFHRVYLGLIYQYEWYDLVQSDTGGMLDTEHIAGSGKGTASGFGLSLNHDTRNHGFTPSEGGWYQFSAVAFHRLFHTTYQFTKYTADVRQYIPLWKSQVLALQGYMSVINGTAPFEMLSTLGGKRMMRGFFEGRYRDDDMIVAQAEYRVPVWGRFGLAAFAGWGDVSPRIVQFDPREFKFAYGGGVRFSINPEERVNLRIDVGHSSDFTGLYITIGEAY